MASFTGMFFAHIQKDPRIEGRFNIRTGVVKSAIGDKHWLLEFHGKNFRFSNVFNADALENFQFFASEAETKAFLDEIIEENNRARQAALEMAVPAAAPEASPTN